MSKKRKSTESNTDEQTNSDPSDKSQQNDDVKRVKLASSSDTMLEDLPLELIECILMEAILAEVQDMHLAKSVWKKKADLVISRLRTVCRRWSNVLTTESFPNEVYETLDRTVEKTIRLEILHQSALNGYATEAIAFNDELFMLEATQGYVINVYDRSDVYNVKDVIKLPGMADVKGIAACNVSNCLYVLNTATHDAVFVYRITKAGEHNFAISPFLRGWLKPSDISVAGNGNLVLWKVHSDKYSAKVVVYDANGSVLHQIKLPWDLRLLTRIILKSNGNIILVSAKERFQSQTMLTEIDMSGTVLRQSSFSSRVFVFQADRHGRIVIATQLDSIQLLDSEFNPLNGVLTRKWEDLEEFRLFAKVNYNGDRNELVTILSENDNKEPVFTIFNFTEK